VRYNFIHAEKTNHPVRLLCKAFGVSESGYYDWCNRPMSERQRKDLVLLTNIRTIHKENYQSYGRDRMTDELRDLGFVISEKRVARLMKFNNIRVIRTHAFKKTTDSDHNSMLLQTYWMAISQQRAQIKNGQVTSAILKPLKVGCI